jgi:HD-like signal output (HDOD) protein
MGRFLVPSRRVVIAVGLDQHKPRGVIALLDDVETGDPGFLDAGAGIGQCGFTECLDAFGLDPYLNMYHQHNFNEALPLTFLANSVARGGENGEPDFSPIIGLEVSVSPPRDLLALKSAAEKPIYKHNNVLMNKCILLVEPLPGRREEIDNCLRGHSDEWQVAYAASEADVMAVAEPKRFDAIVLFGLDSPLAHQISLLNEWGRRVPEAVRCLRFCPEDRETLKLIQGKAPTSLPKECSIEGLREILRRAFQVQAWTEKQALRRLLSEMRISPSLPILYQQIMQELQSPDCHLETVAQIIANEPVICAKMLRLVNSAIFGLSRPISSAFEAVMFLGGDQVKSLILFTQFVCQFDTGKCPAFPVDHLWHHSMATASYSRWIMREETGNAELAEEAFTAGLLHDIGKLLFAANLPEPYTQTLLQAVQKTTPLRHIEEANLGAAHDELGACLLGIWGLPLPILEAIAWHHTPAQGGHHRFSLLSAVHVANAFEHELALSSPDQRVGLVDENYLRSLGLFERCDHWRELCGLSRHPRTILPQ